MDCHTEGHINGHTCRNTDRSMRILGFAKLGIFYWAYLQRGPGAFGKQGGKAFLFFMYLFIPCMVFSCEPQ